MMSHYLAQYILESSKELRQKENVVGCQITRTSSNRNAAETEVIRGCEITSSNLR